MAHPEAGRPWTGAFPPALLPCPLGGQTPTGVQDNSCRPPEGVQVRSRDPSIQLWVAQRLEVTGALGQLMGGGTSYGEMGRDT